MLAFIVDNLPAPRGEHSDPPDDKKATQKRHLTPYRSATLLVRDVDEILGTHRVIDEVALGGSTPL